MQRKIRTCREFVLGQPYYIFTSWSFHVLKLFDYLIISEKLEACFVYVNNFHVIIPCVIKGKLSLWLLFYRLNSFLRSGSILRFGGYYFTHPPFFYPLKVCFDHIHKNNFDYDLIQTININYWDKIYLFYIISNYKKGLFMQNQWFFIFFSFVDNNQNSCDKFTNILMHRVDHERKSQYGWPY